MYCPLRSPSRVPPLSVLLLMTKHLVEETELRAVSLLHVTRSRHAGVSLGLSTDIQSTRLRAVRFLRPNVWSSTTTRSAGELWRGFAVGSTCRRSLMLAVSLPRHPSLRFAACRLSLSQCGRYQVHNPGLSGQRVCYCAVRSRREGVRHRRTVNEKALEIDEVTPREG